MEDLLRALLPVPLEAIARAMRERQFSSRELVEAHLRRIEQVNSGLNAVITLAPDALELAREADEKLAHGEEVGPLHGLPLTVKDTIETAGLRTSSGSLV